MSDLTREYAEYLIGLGASQVQLVKDSTGRELVKTAGKVSVLPQLTCAGPLVVHTLQAVRDYLVWMDGIDMWHPSDESQSPHLVVHVVDEKAVRVLTPVFGEHRQRETRVSATAFLPDPGFRAATWLSQEELMIDLQRCFMHDAELEKLLRFVGAVVKDASLTQDDDGVSQNATIRKGSYSRSVQKVPNPIRLRPFVTFPEIEAPGIDYVVRFDDKAEHPRISLTPIDSQEWRLGCIAAIAAFLKPDPKVHDWKVLA